MQVCESEVWNNTPLCRSTVGGLEQHANVYRSVVRRVIKIDS